MDHDWALVSADYSDLTDVAGVVGSEEKGQIWMFEVIAYTVLSCILDDAWLVHKLPCPVDFGATHHPPDVQTTGSAPERCQVSVPEQSFRGGCATRADLWPGVHGWLPLALVGPVDAYVDPLQGDEAVADHPVEGG